MSHAVDAAFSSSPSGGIASQPPTDQSRDAREPAARSHETPSFVAPSHYLRPHGAGDRQASGRSGKTARSMTAQDIEQLSGLRAIRAFLKVRRTYDVLPLSFRLIVLDNSLLIKKSLNILTQNGEQAFGYNTQKGGSCVDRYCFGAIMGFQNVDLCWSPYRFGLHQRDSILLLSLIHI